MSLRGLRKLLLLRIRYRADFWRCSGTILVQSTDGGTKPIAVTIESNPLYVTGFTPLASGFTVEFNREIDPDLNLCSIYDSNGALLKLADMTVIGPAGPVAGSLIVDGGKLMFVKTGGPLAAGDYTVTLRSADDGFKDAETGQLADGDWPGSEPGFPSGDGTLGGDFVYEFTVAEPAPIVVSLPDFARGPGQPVDVPAGMNGNVVEYGLPIHFSNVNGVKSVEMVIRYDPDLLTVTGVTKAEKPLGSPSNSMVMASVETPGYIFVTAFFSPMPTNDYATDLLTIDAFVPLSAPYGATGVLDITYVSINAGQLASTWDDAIHVVAYLGDADGSGHDTSKDVYSSLDAFEIFEVGKAGPNSGRGFAAYPMIDPMVIGDVTGNGTLSPLDCSHIQEEVLGLMRLAAGLPDRGGYDSEYLPPLPAQQRNRASA